MAMRDWTRCTCECFGARDRLLEKPSYVSAEFEKFSNGKFLARSLKKGRLPRKKQEQDRRAWSGTAGAARFGLA